MNTLNLIIHNGYYYCFCEKYYKKKGSNEKNCDFCQIPYIFSDFEKDITKNIFDEVFLWEYHRKLFFLL